MLQTLFFLVSLTKKNLPEHHPIFTPSHRRQRKPNLPNDGQTNTLILSTAHSDSTAPTDLQRALDNSLDGNADASATDFQ